MPEATLAVNLCEVCVRSDPPRVFGTQSFMQTPFGPAPQGAFPAHGAMPGAWEHHQPAAQDAGQQKGLINREKNHRIQSAFNP